MAKLVMPTNDLVPSFIAALEEGMRTQAKPLDRSKTVNEAKEAPAAFVAALNGPKPATIVLPDGREVERVPDSILWLVDDGEVVGEANIRHRLTPALEKHSGHIGYVVRPSRQRRGYGKIILTEALKFCREMLGLEKVLVTCDDNNLGSMGVIQASGGLLIDKAPNPYDASIHTCRYWVMT